MRLTFYRMETDDQDFGAVSGYLNESLLSAGNATCNDNYINFGGFGSIRRGFNDPSRLDRPSYRQPRVFRPPPHGTFGTMHAMSPIMHNFSTSGYQLPTSSSPLRNDESGHLRSCFDSVIDQGPDCEMTTPDQSRNPSTVEQQQMDPNMCVCSREAHPIPSMNHNGNNTSSLPEDLYEISSPSVQLPNVGNLLNHPSPFQIIQDHHSTSIPNHPPGTNHQNPQNENDHMPNPFSPPESPTTVPLSSVSSSSIQPPFSIGEEKYFLLNTLYNTCLNASSGYICSLLRASRRIDQSLRNRRQQRRRYPYPPLDVRFHIPHSHRGCNAAGRETTLMDNISVICTHIWKKARNDGMAPHRAEADAVRVMRDLYAWGEMLVTGLEAEGRDREEDTDESGLSGLGDEGEGIRIGEAAKRFCEFLRDGRASAVCEGVAWELRELFEMRGRNGSGVEDETEDGLRIR